jgi:hypothetical protein
MGAVVPEPKPTVRLATTPREHREAWCLALLLLLLLGSACVVIDDPNHCWNLDRDATCEELYPGGSVCSRCARGFNGCVDPDDVPAACLDDDAASSSESGAAESSGDSETNTCTGEGPSEACPADAPYCVSGSCASGDFRLSGVSIHPGADQP